MARKIATGIDIGTHQIKVVISELSRDKNLPHVIGMGFAESKGLRHGYIINQHDATRSIRMAVNQAERAANVRARRALISVGGIGLSSTTAQGSIVTSRADSEITDLDIRKVSEASESEIPKSISANRRILHPIPIQYKVDGKIVLGRPHNMKGNKLEVKTLFITALEQHLNDLIKAVEDAGIEVDDVMASPIAASLVTLSKRQKIAGCVLANIGSETVSIVVFENNLPISLEVFPIGSTDITNDIALGLKISLDEAEDIKIGNISQADYSKKKLEEIIVARLSDIFDLMEAHLKKIGRSGLLPAGIIITGGGSGVETIEDLAKASLKIPSKIGEVSFRTSLGGQIKDATWSVAYGLCILGLTADDESSVGIKLAKHTKNKIFDWVKQFLP